MLNDCLAVNYEVDRKWKEEDVVSFNEIFRHFSERAEGANSSKVVCAPVKIRNQYFPNTSQEHEHSNRFPQ